MLLLACAALSLALPARAQSVADLLSGRFSARGIVTTFYEGTEQPPSLVVRIESVRTDYQRKGFFRIALPLTAAGVQGLREEYTRIIEPPVPSA